MAHPQVNTGRATERAAMHNPAFFGAEYLRVEIGEHHLEWARLILKYAQLDILAARGHGKSGFFSYVYPAWRSWRQARTRGMLISDTEDQTAEFFRIMREGVEYTDELGFVWKLPALVDTRIAHLVPKKFERSWTGDRIVFANGSRITGKTFGKRFRGRHVPWIVVDDPHGDDASYSQLARDRDNEFLERAIEPMLLVGGQLIVVGTPLHDEDIHGRRERNSEWKTARFPAIYKGDDGADRVLWPHFRPLHYLESRRRSMGSLAFRQEYLLIPASSEASLFPRELFLERPETLSTWLRLRPTPDEFDQRDWDYFAGVDLAMSANVGADYTVIVVLGVDRHGNRHIVEIVRAKGLSFQAQLSLIRDTLAPFHASKRLAGVLIEANQMQRVFGDELARTTDLPVAGFTTTAQGKNSLASGVPSLRTLIENGKLRFARGDAHSQAETDVMMGELQAFSWLKGKLQGVGAHDDTVMALWIADQAVRQGDALQWWIVDRNGVDDEDAPELAERDLSIAGDPPPASRWSGTGDAGKDAMIAQGYVPPTCTLAPEIAAPLIMHEITGGRSPCWGCNEDRAKCGGAPKRKGSALVQLPGVDDVAARAGLPSTMAPATPQPREWVDTVAACAGDEALARLIPVDRDLRIDGWNSLLTPADKPGWVKAAVSSGKADALYDALRVLLDVGGE